MWLSFNASPYILPRYAILTSRHCVPKKACLNNEVYGLRPAGAAIKTIDSRAYKGCKCWREHNGVSGEAVAVNTGIIASLKKLRQF